MNKYSEDVIVSGAHVKEHNPFVQSNYYNLMKLKNFDSEFKYQGFVFNTGQYVITTCLIKKEEIYSFLEVKNKLLIKEKDIFKCGEQGLTNYFISKKLATNELTVKSTKFYHWIYDKAVNDISLDQVTNGKGVPMLIHWAGTQVPVNKMPRKDILEYYQDYYYTRIPDGKSKKDRRRIMQPVYHFIRKKEALFLRVMNKLINLWGRS